MPSKESLSKEIISFLNWNGIAGPDLDAYLKFCESLNLNFTDYNSILFYKDKTKI